MTTSLLAIKTGFWRAVSAVGLLALLAACGGGGGSSGDPILGGGSPTTPGTPSTPQAVVELSLSSATVTAGSPATVSVNVKTKAGAAIPGLVVKFTTDDGLGAFSAPSALTDANGQAAVVLSPVTSTATGADTVRATVTYGSTDFSASTGFQLSATNVTIASFTSDVAQLSAYGQATLAVVLNGTTSAAPVSLTLTSSCTNAGKGTLTPATQTTSTGRATFTFRDGGCGATASAENLQISVAGTSVNASLSLPVSSPAVASVGFVSAEPAAIYLRGSGLVENSNVTFQVKDANNNGVPDQMVTLEPSVLVGGLTLDGGSVPVTKRTDRDGKVIVRINSGTVPTPVRIKATLQGSNISTVSSALSIAVGLPAQLNFSMAQGTINIEGYDIQGTPNTYTVIASDRLGNPVPNGTAINFVTEGGQVEPEKQTQLSTNGIATATANFATASPVPVDGRVTVVAYALGEESFLDINGDNVFSSGEDFQDLGDIFLDRKYDAFYNAAEDQFVSVSTGEVGACANPNSALLARDVSIPVRPNTCSASWGRAFVRRAVQTVFSTSAARPVWGTEWPKDAENRVLTYGPGGVCAAPITRTGFYQNDVAMRADFRVFGAAGIYGVPKGGALSITASDANPVAYNPVAAGTVITATGTEGLSVSVLGGSPVPSTSTPTGVAVSYKFDDETDEGTIIVTFRSPSGLATSFSQYISAKPLVVNNVSTLPTGYARCAN